MEIHQQSDFLKTWAWTVMFSYIFLHLFMATSTYNQGKDSICIYSYNSRGSTEDNPGTSIQLISRTYSNGGNIRIHQHLSISSGVREYLAMLFLQMSCIYRITHPTTILYCIVDIKTMSPKKRVLTKLQQSNPSWKELQMNKQL